MVKNTTGGSKHKGFARKEYSVSNNKLRLSESEDEKYAHITKMFGNGMCQAYCDDLKTRMCIIRGKFRGKGKRNSFVALGAIVLIGVREWETDSDKCDLLEVYGSNEIEQLKHHPKVPVGFLSLNVLSHSSTAETDESGINFSNIVEEEFQPNIKTKEDFIMDDSETINIDDI